MLKIVVHVNSPPGMIPGVKEQIAMNLERFGDVKVVSVEEIRPQQMQMGGFGDSPQSPPTYSRNRR